MAAGISALLVVLGGGAAGAAMLAGDEGGQPAVEQALAADPGAARLEESPEIVSREAAAAAPPPRRRVHVPVRPAPPPVAKPARTAAATGAELSRARAEDPADRTGSRQPRSAAPRRRETAAKSSAAARPVVTTRTDVETRPIPFETRVIRDHSLPRGIRKVQAPGVPGEETVRYLVTLIDGKPSDRRVLDTTVTRQPEERVVVFGVHREPRCVSALDLCVPLGRTACPAEPDRPVADASAPPAPETGAERDAAAGAERDAAAGAERDAAAGTDLDVIDPEAPADVRREPATEC
ncbi:G5 domain-containing protein [Actinoplanes teichomyceticus]|nr:G5 domain-containing protein [Actinoplanes teichomyceticus]GIF10833.1 hypothetical protein Ate01nite_08650 [Actinoplanes teichomyceticus]